MGSIQSPSPKHTSFCFFSLLSLLSASDGVTWPGFRKQRWGHTGPLVVVLVAVVLVPLGVCKSVAVIKILTSFSSAALDRVCSQVHR